MCEYDLCSLKPGDTAVISRVGERTGLHQRLTDMGFTAGTSIRCLFTGVWKDPTAYWVRGTVIALRAKDAGEIRIRKTEVPV